ncbi:MAG: GH36-type glycosyl hydrolase domain-containing protein [Candidatus Kryptoniota bacterium]
MSKLINKYGHFSADGKEYVIETPRTPRPWINVISNGDYGLAISQAGSGYSWRAHAGLNRITRWDQDLIRDEWGKYIYLFDPDNEHIWSAGWKPVCANPDEYRCIHGTGYSKIDSLYHNIKTSLLVFVPNNDPLEVWKLVIKNTGMNRRRLKIFTFFEWGLGAAPDWHREFHKCFINTRFEYSLNSIIATKRLWEVPAENGHWNVSWPYIAFHSSSERVSSFETDKEEFLGLYGDIRNPAIARSSKKAGLTGNSLDAIGSLNVDVDLMPGEERIIYFTIGAADDYKHAGTLIRKYAVPANVEKEFLNVLDRWKKLLSTVYVKTPDESLNILLNTWLKYQAISGRLWGRTAYYQTGGAFGFRDQLQDSQIYLTIDPDLTRKQIKLHARHQNSDGTVLHWWHPLSEVGLNTNMTDDLLWLPFLVVRYIEETGDAGILFDREFFLNGRMATILEHCNRAIDRSLSRLSSRGLPLIGAGDWNDGLSALGLKWKGESIWLAEFLYKVLIDYSAILSRAGRERIAKKYIAASLKIRNAVNRFGWDGKWYWSATKDSGEKIGSHNNREGKIHLNAQTWSVISGIAPGDRAEIAMLSVEKYLEKEIGPLLLYPAYKTPDPEIGYLTRYSPGMRENGGVYTHAATWAVIAEALLGKGNEAYRMFSKINPINSAKNPDRYCAEPYVTPGNIDGPDSPFYGRGGWTWYTGSAAWLFKSGLEYILGIRPTMEGLLIDPCIPTEWEGFTVTRRFRNSTFTVKVVNPDHVSCGVVSVHVDGQTLKDVSNVGRGIILPTFNDGFEHDVLVILGNVRKKDNKLRKMAR